MGHCSRAGIWQLPLWGLESGLHAANCFSHVDLSINQMGGDMEGEKHRRKFKTLLIYSTQGLSQQANTLPVLPGCRLSPTPEEAADLPPRAVHAAQHASHRHTHGGISAHTYIPSHTVLTFKSPCSPRARCSCSVPRVSKAVSSSHNRATTPHQQVTVDQERRGVHGESVRSQIAEVGSLLPELISNPGGKGLCLPSHPLPRL